MALTNGNESPKIWNDLTDEMLKMPPEVLKEASKYPFHIFPNKEALYNSLAREMADEIKKNNECRNPTRWILPVGPKAQYPILAEITNREKISWKQVFSFHMDEYLDWQGRPVPIDHPFSFRGYCHKHLYSLIDPELLPPPEQIIFPSVNNIDDYSARLESVGGADVTYGGFGYRGLVAFNEPPSTRWHKVSVEEMEISKTRIVHLLDDTLIALSQRMTGGYTQAIPRMAITIGMADILASRKIHLVTDGGAWKRYILRVLLLTTDRNPDLPVTLCHGHPHIEVSADYDSALPITIGLD
jgi:glucosamine-6-phosphate deaminase